MNKEKILKDNEHLRQPVECYSRVVGYFRPINNWNKGKKKEFFDRKTYCIEDDKH